MSIGECWASELRCTIILCISRSFHSQAALQCYLSRVIWLGSYQKWLKHTQKGHKDFILLDSLESCCKYLHVFFIASHPMIPSHFPLPTFPQPVVHGGASPLTFLRRSSLPSFSWRSFRPCAKSASLDIIWPWRFPGIRLNQQLATYQGFIGWNSWDHEKKHYKILGYHISTI